MHPVHIFSPYFPKIHYNIIFPSTPTSSEWSLPFRFCNQIWCVSCLKEPPSNIFRKTCAIVLPRASRASCLQRISLVPLPGYYLRSGHYLLFLCQYPGTIFDPATIYNFCASTRLLFSVSVPAVSRLQFMMSLLSESLSLIDQLICVIICSFQSCADIALV
jgi:hypothetical protein